MPTDSYWSRSTPEISLASRISRSRTGPNGPLGAEQQIAEYKEKFANPYIAAERGDIDEIIDPRFTRRKLITAIDMLRNKRDKSLPKQHGNIPL